MKRKYTEPCPHCKQPMERAPTLEEQVHDIIDSGICETHEIMYEEKYWPGTQSLTNRVLERFKHAGITFVREDDLKDQTAGYLAGLRKAREIGLQLGSPLSAKLTELIEIEEKRK